MWFWLHHPEPGPYYFGFSYSVGSIDQVSATGQSLATYTPPEPKAGLLNGGPEEAGGSAWLVRRPDPSAIWVERVAPGGAVSRYVVPTGEAAQLGSVAVLRQGGLSIPVTCKQACAGTLTLTFPARHTSRASVKATGRFSLARAGSKNIQIRLSAAARKKIHRDLHLVAHLSMTAPELRHSVLVIRVA